MIVSELFRCSLLAPYSACVLLFVSERPWIKSFDEITESRTKDRLRTYKRPHCKIPCYYCFLFFICDKESSKWSFHNPLLTTKRAHFSHIWEINYRIEINKVYTLKERSLDWINSAVFTTFFRRCSIASQRPHSFSLSIDSLDSWRVEAQTLVQIYPGFIRRLWFSNLPFSSNLLTDRYSIIKKVRVFTKTFVLFNTLSLSKTISTKQSSESVTHAIWQFVSKHNRQCQVLLTSYVYCKIK